MANNLHHFVPNQFRALLPTILRHTIPVACGLPLFTFDALAQNTSAPQSEKLGAAMQTTSPTGATTLTSPSAWDAFRYPVPPMSPSWRSGDLSVQVVANTGITYDDSILQSSAQAERDFIWEFSPQFRARWEPASWATGNMLELAYSPQAQVYFDHGSLDTVNHSGGISLAWSRGKTTVDFNHQAALTSQPELIQTGRDRQHQENTTLSITREVGARTRLDTRLHNNYNQVQGGLSNWEFGGGEMLDYLVRERLAIGAGYGLSYADSGSVFQALIHEPQVELKWLLAERTRIGIATGVEILCPTGTSGGDTKSGLMVNATASHTLTDKTSLQLGLSRNQRPSRYAGGQLDELSQATFGVSYQLSERIRASTTGSYGYNTQTAYSSSVTSAGSYSYWQAGLSLDYSLTARMGMSLSYSHSWRESNLATTAFDRNTASLGLSYRL